MKNVQRSIKAVRSAGQRFGNRILDKNFNFSTLLKKEHDTKNYEIWFLFIKKWEILLLVNKNSI